jgi:Vitamin B12 dependent methionine synthase, activation domain
MTILDNIQIQLDLEAVRRRLHLKRDNDLKVLQDLVAIAQPLVEPKVLYKVCFIEEKREQGVIIESLYFSSKVLRKNLDKIERVFPFVITIGSRFSEQLEACSDLLEKFYLDTIGNVALNQVRLELKNHLKSDYAIEKTAFMAPGSLPDWPINEQMPLFKLLGDVEASVGVKLTESLLMLPAKSVSGIYFPTETSFFSCQLCPRERCDSRKAGYNEKLAQEYGIKKLG